MIRSKSFITLALAAALVLAGCGKGINGPGDGGNDGNVGWIRQNSVTANDLLAVSFSDTSNGWAVGWFTILHTTDGGRTWSPQTQNAARQGALFTGVSSPDSSHCWVVGADGSIQATSDAGRTWRLQDTGLAGSSLYGVAFSDTTNGWACGRRSGAAGAAIRYTQNGGGIWVNGDATGIQELRAISVSKPYSFRVVACGLLGTVATSVNGGVSWIRSPSTGTTQMLQGVAMLPGNGLSVLAGGVPGIGGILRTFDGGDTWQPSQSLPAGVQVNGLDMASFNVGWMVGTSSAHSEVARTSDGGLSWLSQFVNWGLPLNGVCAVNSNYAWAVGDQGAIFFTRTGGN
ncbi:MAG: hypothetical protein HZB25_04490 [Candidatus Eisenbacteria bacterium]|nr:hypothetical protein [Candidatus Eisenbacteria bacterium]